MSRIGKIPVSLPSAVKVNITPTNVHIEGAKGKLDLAIPQGIVVESKDQKLIVSRSADSKQDRANHGTIRARLVQMIVGVTQGHRKDLEIQGLGFRASMQGNKVVFNFGFSHPVEFESPKDVKISTPTQTSVIIEGVDKEKVGQTAAVIRKFKPVEPYKGKGVRYVGEFVKRKQGKSVTK